MWRLMLPTPPRLIMLSCSSLAEPLTAAGGGGGLCSGHGVERHWQLLVALAPFH